jgi:glycosyltransferase involved in cell wall biosynthesis
MKILQVSSAENFGGGEKHLVDLIGGLAAKGHEVFLAAPAGSPLRERTGLPPGNIFDVKIRNSLDLPAARKLASIINEYQIDVVHAHMARDYFPVSLAARFARRFTGAKLVLTRHVLFPMKTMHRFALSNVSRVIAVSAAVEKQLKKENIFPPEKIANIPNGIDTAHWADIDIASRSDLRKEFRDAHNIPHSAALVGTIGELKKLKGQEDFILSAEIILQKNPETYFIVVGRDNSAGGEYKKHLRGLAGAIGAADRFIWLDWIDDTAPLLFSLDVFVSASHSESFGLAMLEAMASGCTVVATETEGAKELLGRQSLPPIEDPVKLAEAVCLFLNDENKRAETAQENRRLARETFDIKKMIDATEKLYLEL